MRVEAGDASGGSIFAKMKLRSDLAVGALRLVYFLRVGGYSLRFADARGRI